MIKAILFDFGNTLVRHDNLDWTKLERAGLFNQISFLEKRGVKGVTYKAWNDWFKKLYSEQESLAKKYYVEIDIQRIFHAMHEIFHLPSDMKAESLARMFYQPICQSRILFDDVRETLKKLQSLKLPMGVISNSVIPGAMVRDVLAQLGLIEYLDLILISSDIGYRKPHPLMFEIAETRLRLKPKEIMFVGDQPADDVAGAQQAGFYTVWLNRTQEKNKTRITPDLTLHSLHEILLHAGRSDRKGK